MNVISPRLSGLDGIRGLAAFTVVTWHFMSVFLSTSLPQYETFGHVVHALSFTPLAAAWAGSQAVFLFFILSGFVLHRMLMPRKMTYGSYAARRMIRLWLPYAVVIVLAAAAIYFAGSRKIAGQSVWLNGFLAPGLSWHILAQHFLMVGVFNTASFDFVIWSLVQEMRLSLVFPLIFWAVQSGKPWVVLLASVLIEVMATYISHHVSQPKTGLISTLHYQIYFVIGAVLSKHEADIQTSYNMMTRTQKSLVLLVSITLYSHCFRVSADYSEMLGSTLIIIFALSSGTAIKVLHLPIVQWFGKISYSLYLCHIVILLLMINLLYPLMSFTVIVMLCIPAALISAVILNYCVEQPAIMWSRKAGQALRSPSIHYATAGAGD